MKAIGGAVLASGAFIVGECLDVRWVFDLLATLERARMLGRTTPASTMRTVCSKAKISSVRFASVWGTE